MALPERTVSAFRHKDRVKPANAPDQKPSEEVIDQFLKSQYGDDSEALESTSKSVDLVDTVDVNGRKLPLNTQVDIDLDDISGVFYGNHRKVPKKVEELASSIINSDFMHNSTPVVLRPDGNGKLELVVGTRRRAAIKLARSRTQENYRLIGIIEQLTDIESYVKATLENLSREDLSPWEFAETLQGLLDIKAAKTVDDLRNFLPADQNGREPKRNKVYFYLAPARLNAHVRELIDEEKPCVFKDFQVLNKVLNSMSVTIEHLNESVKEEHGVGKVSIKWLIKHINENYVPDEKKGSKPYEVNDKDGNMMVRIKRNSDGVGATIQLTGSAPEGLIEEIEALIKSRVD